MRSQSLAVTCTQPRLIYLSDSKVLKVGKGRETQSVVE